MHLDCRRVVALFDKKPGLPPLRSVSRDFFINAESALALEEVEPVLAPAAPEVVSETGLETVES